jgi:uncharacterized membrane protein YhaH (DUF805 family)
LDNIYSAPAADMTANVASDETYTPQFLSIHGRIGRLRVIAYPMGATLLFMVAAAILGALGMALSKTLVNVLIVLLYIPMIAISFVFTIRRLNDLNKSGWLSLVMLIPLVNFFFGLYLWCAPGTPGPNDYGPAPGPNTRAVVAGALVLPIIMIIGILAAVSIPAYQDYVHRAKAAESQKL